MKRKSILLVAFIMAMILLLSACSSGFESHTSSSKQEEPIDEKTFFILESYTGYGEIVVDKDTLVMYWVTHSYYNSGNLTMLVNSDGTPKVFKGEQND